jgi:hypothetical protein
MTLPRTPDGSPTEAADVRRRELAIKRIRAKHVFRIHLVVYVVTNVMLVAIWAGLGSSVAVMASPGPRRASDQPRQTRRK